MTERSAAGFLAHVEKLHALRVLSRATGLRGAAAELGIAPSSLSERLRLLEETFGRALVVRGRRLSLTPYARELVDAAAGPLDALVTLGPTVATRQRAPRLIRIGAYDSLAVHVLPRLLEEVRGRTPSERFDVRVGRTNVLVKGLAAGTVDLAAVIGVPEGEKLESIEVATEELVVALPRGLREAEAWRLVRSGAWVGLAPSSDGHPPFYRRFCELAGLTVPPVLSCDSFEVVRSVAATSRLPALLPRRVARRGKGLETVAVDPRAGSASRHPIVIVRRRAFASPVFDALLGSLRRALASDDQ